MLGFLIGFAYAYLVKLPGRWKWAHLALIPVAAFLCFVGYALLLQYAFPGTLLPVPSGGYLARDFFISAVICKLALAWARQRKRTTPRTTPPV